MADYKRELEELISTVSKEGASDRHFSVGHCPTIRGSSELVPLTKYEKLAPEATMGFVIELLSDESQKRFLARKEIDFSYSPGAGIRFRGNAFFQKGVVGIAMRVIPQNIPTLTELNLPEALLEFANKKQGFFLVVGPTGHGKSTTLASLIDHISRERAEHIITIEDPVEYIYEAQRSIIDQREIHFDTHDFHTALQSMFREDINVALIGEMRDPETMSAAVTAAETGHLIFSTLHTNTASQTIDRVLDSFPAVQQKQIRVQLAANLLGVFSQRLVPRVSGGLIPAYELLLNNKAVANLIREGRTAEIDVILETSMELGMIDLNHSLADLFRRGEITQENAYRFSTNPDVLERLL